jgi:hypothetical protein
MGARMAEPGGPRKAAGKTIIFEPFRPGRRLYIKLLRPNITNR